jgi:beta-lactam-binding protein with PASTA domain
VPGPRGPDLTKTIDPIKCTEPQESGNDPDKIQIPDFVFKNWKSVQECLQAKGWKYDTTDVNENTYGEDTVMRQSPTAGSDADPDDMPRIQLDISTGNPPQ